MNVSGHVNWGDLWWSNDSRNQDWDRIETLNVEKHNPNGSAFFHFKSPASSMLQCKTFFAFRLFPKLFSGGMHCIQLMFFIRCLSGWRRGEERTSYKMEAADDECPSCQKTQDEWHPSLGRSRRCAAVSAFPPILWQVDHEINGHQTDLSLRGNNVPVFQLALNR